MKKRGNLIVFLVGLSVSLVTLWFTFKDVDFAALRNELIHANYWWGALAVVTLIVANFLRGIRWRALLLEVPDPLRIFYITHIAYLMSNILPLRLGELVRIYLVTRDPKRVPAMQAFSTAILERLLDILVVMAMLSFTLPFVPNRNVFVNSGQIAAVLATLALLGLFLAAWKKEFFLQLLHRVFNLLGITRWFPRLAELFENAFANFLGSIAEISIKYWVRAIFWTILVWILSALCCWFLLLGFLPTAPWYAGFFTTGLTALGMAVPSAPSGVGLFEFAVISALNAFHVTSSTALAYAICLHLLNFIFINLLGWVGLAREGESLQHLITSAQQVARPQRSPSV